MDSYSLQIIILVICAVLITAGVLAILKGREQMSRCDNSYDDEEDKRQYEVYGGVLIGFGVVGLIVTMFLMLGDKSLGEASKRVGRNMRKLLKRTQQHVKPNPKNNFGFRFY